MTWLLIFPALWLISAVTRWLRPLTDQHDIRYHWHSQIARMAARMRGSPNNYAVTLGRHTFVRMGFIRAEHAAHEFRHTVQAERWGAFLFLVRAIYEYIRYGYHNAPIERDARDYAAAHAGRFREMRA